MIVITRQLGEKVNVGPITITVVDIHADLVRLGLEVPREMPVYRQDAAHLAPSPTTEGDECDPANP